MSRELVNFDLMSWPQMTLELVYGNGEEYIKTMIIAKVLLYTHYYNSLRHVCRVLVVLQ